MKHALERTSPKGQIFIGVCRLCGTPNLRANAALEDCPNPRGLDRGSALIEAILGDDHDAQAVGHKLDSRKAGPRSDDGG